MNDEDINNDLDHLDQKYQDNQINNPSDTDHPFSQPDDIPQKVDDTHQSLDTNIDPDEAYHEGLGEAAETDDPQK